MFIIKLFSFDLKTILLFYIYSSTKYTFLTGNIPPCTVLVKPSMFALSKFYNSVPSLSLHEIQASVTTYGTATSPNGRSGE